MLCYAGLAQILPVCDHKAYAKQRGQKVLLHCFLGFQNPRFFQSSANRYACKKY